MRPEILLFHDFLSESESTWIKDTAYPMLQRATIMDPITGKLRHAEYRVSKSTWLPPEDYEEVRKLRERATAVTGNEICYPVFLFIQILWHMFFILCFALLFT